MSGTVRRSSRGSTGTFEPLAKGEISVLKAMVFALYREDPPARKMSARKIRRTISELAAHREKGAITLIRSGRQIIGYAIVIYYWSNEYGGNIACIDEL